MATLNDFKGRFLVVAKWVGIILAVIIGIFILIRAVFFIKEQISPSPPPQPPASFGKLPKILFPEGIKNKFTYKIDTISGELPDFSDQDGVFQANIYKMEKGKPDILAAQKTIEKANSLGFDPKPDILSETTYRFASPGPPPKSLVVNLNMTNFNLYSAYLSDPLITSGVNLPSEGEAISIARNFIESLDAFPPDIDEDKTKTEFYDIKNQIFGPVDSISKAKLISVYFFQKDLDGIPIVYPTGNVSIMNLVVGGSEGNSQVVNARFFHQTPSEEFSSYYIKSADEAYGDLKKGNAYIASYNSTDLNIVIKKVYLGYYVEGRLQDYLMPVVVFEGNNGFIAYVSAVKDDWIRN